MKPVLSDRRLDCVCLVLRLKSETFRIAQIEFLVCLWCTLSHSFQLAEKVSHFRIISKYLIY